METETVEWKLCIWKLSPSISHWKTASECNGTRPLLIEMARVRNTEGTSCWLQCRVAEALIQ